MVLLVLAALGRRRVVLLLAFLAVLDPCRRSRGGRRGRPSRAAAVRRDAYDVWALILRIRDPVTIPVGSDRRAAVILRRSGRRRAVIGRVRNAVAVLVPWRSEEEVAGKLIATRDDLGGGLLDHDAAAEVAGGLQHG